MACRFDITHGASWLFASMWELIARAGPAFVVCGAGAASQHILLGIPRLPRAPLATMCHVCLRSVLLLELSSDTNEGFAACRLIFTMLYLTFNDKQNKPIFFSKSREHTAYALRSPKISREHTRMPAYHCHYNTVYMPMN